MRARCIPRSQHMVGGGVYSPDIVASSYFCAESWTGLNDAPTNAPTPDELHSISDGYTNEVGRRDHRASISPEVTEHAYDGTTLGEAFARYLCFIGESATTNIYG